MSFSRIPTENLKHTTCRNDCPGLQRIERMNARYHHFRGGLTVFGNGNWSAGIVRKVGNPGVRGGQARRRQRSPCLVFRRNRGRRGQERSDQDRHDVSQRDESAFLFLFTVMTIHHTPLSQHSASLVTNNPADNLRT